MSLKTYIRRCATKWLNLSRPSSWPYVSGDSFRALAQHVHDETSSVRGGEVHEGDIVFVRTQFLEEFLEGSARRIQHKYVLITHNEDIEITPENSAFLSSPVFSEKIIHWFAQNLTYNHPRISHIPIGLEDLYYRKNGLIDEIKLPQKESQKISTEKNGTLAWGFSLNSRAIRIEAARILEGIKYAEHLNIQNHAEYYSELKKYKFIASPAGRGEACHNTWEALYLGVIPVVIKSPMMEYFSSIGIPLYMINSWDDMKTTTKEQLDTFYDAEMQKLCKNENGTFDVKALYMEYWSAQIAEKSMLI